MWKNHKIGDEAYDVKVKYMKMLNSFSQTLKTSNQKGTTKWL